MRLRILFPTLLLLTGCQATEVDKNLAFDPATATKGIVVVGMRVDQPFLISTSLQLDRLDQGKDSPPLELIKRPRGSNPSDAMYWDYLTAEIEPGEYIVSTLSLYIGTYTTRLCLANTSRFAVARGEVVYIGDYTIKFGERQGLLGEPPFMGFDVDMDEAAAQHAITSYPRIKAVPRKADLKPAKAALTEERGPIGNQIKVCRPTA